MNNAPIDLAHSPAFRVGRMEVRPATREVIGPKEREFVEPRVMQVLVALGRADGEILSRDDLVQSCWDGRIVSENAIDRVISKVRRLGDRVAESSFRLETITKVGYRLLAEDRTVAAGSPPPAAVQSYQRGVDALRRGWAEDAASAVSAFRQAVDIAPDYADAWGMLAIAYQQSLQFMPPDTGRVMHERARSAARRGLDLDLDNANARAAQALAVPIYGNWADAESACRQVLALDPQQVEMRQHLSRVLADVGRTSEAVAALGPLDEQSAAMPFRQFWLAWLLFSAGRLEESDRVIDQALGVWPRNFAVWFTRFWLYAYTGRPTQAIAMVSDSPNRPIGIPDRDFQIVAVSARAIATRSRADIEAAVAANREAAPSGVGYCVNAIKVSAFLGRVDDAFAAAEALYLGRGFHVAATYFAPQQGGYTPPEQRSCEFLFSPVCEPMRSDSRFGRLLHAIGLERYWRETRTGADIFRAL